MNLKFLEKFKEDFKEQTAIQKAVEEPLLKGENVLGIAPTGSGKTLAYSLPLIEKILKGDGVQLLILVSSKELASQIRDVISVWAKLIDLKVLSIIGGANVKRQIEKLKKQKPEIIVGTPGRVLNLVNDKKIKLHTLESIVIDEADDLLSGKETLRDCRQLVSSAPSKTQLSFFSATENEMLDDLNHWFGIDVRKIDVRKIDNTQGEVVHYMVELPVRKKIQALKKLANNENFYGLVFFNHVENLNNIYEQLLYQKVSVAKLSSDQKATERKQALSKLKKREVSLLLTTDVLARGLDIEKLPAVINYDIPLKQETYIHRVGRTGRMGAIGTVVNIGNEHELRNFKKIMINLGYEIKKGYIYKNKIELKREISSLNEPKKSNRKAIEKTRVKNRARNQKTRGFRFKKEQ